MDVWKWDLLHEESLEKFDIHRHILSFIDPFSKLLHLIPVQTKSSTVVASPFRSIFHYEASRRPVGVRTDKGNEILIKLFQDMLRRESIQFQVGKKSDVKCVVVERAHRTIHDRL